jgi:DNA-binding beta-propeller fold protein YncE
MAIVNGKLYVALQRLNNFIASNDSYIVVIDTGTDQIIDLDPVAPGVQPIVLQGRNPFGKLTYLPSTDRIYVADASNFSTGDAYGGIEAINPNTDTTDGIIIPDDAFGGSVGTLVILSDTVAYIIVADTNFNNSVKPLNLSTLTPGNALTGISTAFLPGMAFDNSGFLYIADQDSTQPGIQVFDTTTNLKVEGPINTGLPPFEIAFVGP